MTKREFLDKVFEKGANTHHREMQTVTAWCELPEPFKGVTT